MTNSKTKSRKKRERFWTGSGKFFLSVIGIYLFIFFGYKIMETDKDMEIAYSRNDIQIQGNRLISTEKILKECSFSKNDKRKKKIDFKSVAKNLLALKYIKGVSITKRPPRLLNITIDERMPVAFIYGKGLNLIDDSGYLMPVPEMSRVWDLPLISGVNEKLGKLGKPAIAAEVYAALEIISYIEMENPLLTGLISEINMANKSYIELILIRGGTTVRVSRDYFDKELYILKTYVANYLDWENLKNIEYIDLRFKNQLIVKERIG